MGGLFKTLGNARKRGIKLPRLDLSIADFLTGQSEIGGTKLEQLVDGAAAELGIVWDAAQYYVPIGLTGEYTLVDRVIFHPLTAVYVDGPQHELRVERAQRDLLQQIDLESHGWRVVRLGWKALAQDARTEVMKVLWQI